MEDKEHDLWICTDGGGVNCLNRKSKTFTYYMASGGNSIIHNNVKSITYDKKRDHIYIGTYTGGLSRYDRKVESFIIILRNLKRQEKVRDKLSIMCCLTMAGCMFLPVMVYGR